MQLCLYNQLKVTNVFECRQVVQYFKNKNAQCLNILTLQKSSLARNLFKRILRNMA